MVYLHPQIRFDQYTFIFVELHLVNISIATRVRGQQHTPLHHTTNFIVPIILQALGYDKSLYKSHTSYRGGLDWHIARPTTTADAVDLIRHTRLPIILHNGHFIICGYMFVHRSVISSCRNLSIYAMGSNKICIRQITKPKVESK